MGCRTPEVRSRENIPPAADLVALLQPISLKLTEVESELARQVEEFDTGVANYVQYVLGGTGKRLRPSLALLSGGATGEITANHIKLGVIVELIHVATLVHDDVLDEAQLRHGLSTSNSRWGNEISVLLGDCLFAHALRLAASYPTTEVCRRVSEATNTVCSGEIVQTQKRFDLKLGLDEYLSIMRKKTGALFAVSCELGGSLNAAHPSVVKGLKEFGANLGIAYQIYDDCVDIFGQERKAGKSLGTDMKKGKLTLPFILLLQHAGADNRREIGEMILRGDAEERRQLVDLISGNGVVTESLTTIHEFLDRAEASLNGLASNACSESLLALAHYLATQSKSLVKQAVAA